MDFKKIRKNIGRFLSYFIGYLGLNFCSLAIKIIPASMLYGFAEGLASLAYVFAIKQRKIAMDSLNIAFGKEKPLEEIKKIAKDCFVVMAKSGVELMFLMDKPELLKKQVDLINKENLERALSKGKGVILVSAHFGNFPLMLAKLSLEGYKTAGIMRYMRDERMEKFFMAKRNKVGLKTIYSQPRKACVDESIRSLRGNELVFIPIDQNFGEGGVFVDFFGRKAATATGPIILARRTGAIILPCFIVRQPGDRHQIIFDKSIELEEGPDTQEAIRANIQRLTNIIEVYIRKYPKEWSWIHRRWKSTP
ncbi:MAG: lysophospholipid acyltransferase family protein [Candidatus Omnitrophota bacterium]